MQTKLDIADEVIAANMPELTKYYYTGKHQATHNWRQAGLNKAYNKLNEFLPDDFRQELPFSEAMLLNSQIKGLLTRRNELH